MSTDERFSQLEQSHKMLVELLRRADERTDTHQSWINQLGAAQAELEIKMSALVDAQIRVKDTLMTLETKMAALADAHAQTEVSLAAFEIKMSALVDAQISTEDALKKLSEAQERTAAQLSETNVQLSETDARLNKLVDTVERYISQRRNGQP